MILVHLAMMVRAMTKCDFCPHSINKKGICVCPHSFCILSQADIKEILNKIVRVQNGN
jgi:hypothetical protein